MYKITITSRWAARAAVLALTAAACAGTSQTAAGDVPTYRGEVVETVQAGGPVRRSPAIGDGTAYVAADTGIVTAFDVVTGEVRWSLDLAASDVTPLNQPEVSTPAFSNGVLYLVRGPLDMSVPHEVVAIDVTTRAVRWRSTSPSADRLFVGAVTDDALFTVGEDGEIRRLDLETGTPEPFFTNSAGMGALPTLVDDTLYVSSYDGIIRAIDLATGTERWHVQVQGKPTMPVVVDGRVYVGTDLGRAVVIGDPAAM